MGYGRIVDEGAEATGNAPVKVVLYTRSAVPSVPHRAAAGRLRKQMGFTLEKIDVTLGRTC